MHSFKNKIKRLIGDDTIYIVKDIINKVVPSKAYLADFEDNKIKKAFYARFVEKGDTFFDVGANVGNRIAPLLELGVKVIAFEPQHSCKNILKWRFGNKMTLVPKALGENDGSNELHISNFSGISSLSTEWINSVKNTRFKNYEWKTTEKVETTTLDRAITKYGIPKFVKIDVEGFELEVLKGLSQSIDMISFEYTTPEQTDKAIACIDRIASFSANVRFNYSVGESMEFSLKDWVPTDQMISLVKTPKFIQTGFGDIYARNR